MDRPKSNEDCEKRCPGEQYLQPEISYSGSSLSAGKREGGVNLKQLI